MLETIMWGSFQEQDNILSIKTPLLLASPPPWLPKNEVGNTYSHIILQMILSVSQLTRWPAHMHVVILFLCDWKVWPGILSTGYLSCSRFLSWPLQYGYCMVHRWGWDESKLAEPRGRGPKHSLLGLPLHSLRCNCLACFMESKAF